jgi:cyclase
LIFIKNLVRTADPERPHRLRFDADTIIVPGHGTLIRRDDIIPYRDMILAVQLKVQQMIAQGRSLQDVLAAKVTAPYDAKVAGGTGASADRFITAMYAELKGSGK